MLKLSSAAQSKSNIAFLDPQISPAADPSCPVIPPVAASLVYILEEGQGNRRIRWLAIGYSTDLVNRKN